MKKKTTNKELIQSWQHIIEVSLQDAEADEQISYIVGSDIPDEVIAFYDHESGKEIWLKVMVKE